MKKIALAFSLVLLITVADGQSKFRVRPHFLGLSFYSPKTTFQIGFLNRTEHDCSFYGKILQFGILNFATGPSGIQMGILNGSRVGGFFIPRGEFWSPPQQRYRLLLNKKIFCQ